MKLFEIVPLQENIYQAIFLSQRFEIVDERDNNMLQNFILSAILEIFVVEYQQVVAMRF